MSRDWDDLMKPELTDESRGRLVETKKEEDKTDVDLDYSNVSASSESVADKAEESIEGRENSFIAGGCKPEEDGDIACKFNLGGQKTVDVTQGGERKKATFEKPVLQVEDADQTRSSNSIVTRVSSGVGVVQGNKFTFCRSAEGDEELVCRSVDRPDDVLNLLQHVEGDKYITGKSREVELEGKREFTTDSVKFPEGGKVEVVVSEGRVNVKPLEFTG